MTGGADAGLAARHTSDSAAVELYLRGRSRYYRYSRDGNLEAIALFRQAVARDSGFALAWAVLSDAFAEQGHRFDEGRAWADSAVRSGRSEPLRSGRDSLDVLSALALVHAGLGNAGATRAYADAVLRADPITVDAVIGPVWLSQIAAALAMIGDSESALRCADSLLSIPARFPPS